MSVSWPLRCSQASRLFGTAAARIALAGALAALILVTLPVLMPGLAGAQSGGPKTFTVNSVVDASDMSIGDGNCRAFDAGSPCTLRAAIEESNARPGTDTILIDPGVYELE